MVVVKASDIVSFTVPALHWQLSIRRLGPIVSHQECPLAAGKNLMRGSRPAWWSWIPSALIVRFTVPALHWPHSVRTPKPWQNSPGTFDRCQWQGRGTWQTSMVVVNASNISLTVPGLHRPHKVRRPGPVSNLLGSRSPLKFCST